MFTIVLLGVYVVACSKEPTKDISKTKEVSSVQEETKKEVEQTQEAPSLQQNEEKSVETDPSAQQKEEQAEKTEKAPAIKQEQPKFIVVIDPGHQQKANLNLEPIGPGATKQKYKVTDGTTGVVTKKRESELVLEAAFILKEMLEAKGFDVRMTRTTQDVNMSNRERATFANEQQANLFLRLHADGSESPAQKGFAVLTPAEGSEYTKGIYEESLQVSQFIINRMKENKQVQVNGIKFRDDLSGFNWSKVPGVLLELGFMSNSEEDQKLSDRNYLDPLLQNVADSVEEYQKSKS